MKKVLIPWMALLLMLAPVLGVTGSQASAATSRVAVVKSLTGTVNVKKAGGSKEFKAFARMSLNEGDVLTTADDSTAVLQFANGTKEDDTMTVSAKTTLSFSKLTERGATRTKVSMWSGSAWVDVKSIANNNDEFTLETPTAVMGVRGTHFLAGVDPLTKSTFLGVMAGIVNAKRNAGDGGSTGSNEDNEGANVYPTQQFTFGTDDTNPQDNVSTIDMESLVGMLSPSVIQQMLQQKAAIDAELAAMQQQLRNQMQSGSPNGLPNKLSGVANEEELQQLINNMNQLIGAIIGSAIQGSIIDKDTVDQMMKDLNQNFVYSNVKLDLTDRQKKMQDEAREREEARRKAKQEVEQTRDKAKDELLNKKKELEEKNKEKLELLKQQQREAYEKQLSEAERARFERDRKLREAENAKATPSPSPNAANGSSGGNSGGDTGSSYVNPLQSLVVEYYETGPMPSSSPIPAAVRLQVEVPIQSGESTYSSNLGYVIEDIVNVMPVAKNSTDVITVKTRLGANDTAAIPVVPETMYGIENVESNAPTVSYPVKLRGNTTYIDIWVKTAASATPTKFTYQVNRQLLPTGVTVTGGSGNSLADIGGNRLLLEVEDPGSSYDFAVNGQGVKNLHVSGYGSSVEQSNVLHLVVPDEDGVYKYEFDFVLDNKSYEYEVVVKTGLGSPFAQTDKSWIADGLEIVTDNETQLPVAWDSSSSSFKVMASVEDGEVMLVSPYGGWDMPFTIEVVEDMENGTILTKTYVNYLEADVYVLDTHSTNHSYRLYLKDESGKYWLANNLELAVNPWPVGIMEMKAGYASSPDGTIEVTVPLQLHTYTIDDANYSAYVAQPTVTDQVYGELQIVIDPNQIDQLELMGANQSLVPFSYDDITHTYTFGRTDQPGIHSFVLMTKDYDGHYRYYDIALVGGEVAKEKLHGGPVSELGDFEQVGPNEWTYYSFNDEQLQSFEFKVDWEPEDTEVWVDGSKLDPEEYVYSVHYLEDGDIVPITIKLHNPYHIGSPTVHNLTFYNGEIAGAVPGMQSMKIWNGTDWDYLFDPQPQPFSYKFNVYNESSLLLPEADGNANVIAVYEWYDEDFKEIEFVSGGYPVNVEVYDTKMLFVIIESGPYKKSVQVLLYRTY